MTYSFSLYHGPGVNSAPSENEYQEHFLGVKAAGVWGWQPHHLHVQNVMKSGSLNLLEPSGPHRACYRTPLPFLQKIVQKSCSYVVLLRTSFSLAIHQSYPSWVFVFVCVSMWEREREIYISKLKCVLVLRHEVHSWTLCHHAAGIQVQQVGVSIPVGGVEIPCHLLQPHIQGF